MSTVEERSADPAVKELLRVAREENIETVWDRRDKQLPLCGFGSLGTCCRICLQGPCRIDPFGEGADRGICGATDYTIVCRNLIRYIAGGTAAHSGHGRHIAETIVEMVEGKAPDYRVSDPDKLRRVAARLRIDPAGKSDKELAREVAEEALKDYSSCGNRVCAWVDTTITPGRRKKFKETGIMPPGIDTTVARTMQRSTMGVDADPVNLIFGGLQTALSDYDGCHLSTDLTDILFGTPKPVKTEANLGVLDPKKVNIAVHGHTPILSQIVVQVAREMEGEARAAGAEGINLVGICCTGNEVLMREGVPLATNFLAQELAIMTGCVDLMVVDLQCIMPSLKTVADCFHTKLVTTMPIARIPGTYHVEFREDKARESARTIIKLAIESFRGRDKERVHIPDVKNEVIAGFSLEAMLQLFSNVDKERPIRALVSALDSGELRGVALFAGCNSTRVKHDSAHLALAKELARNDVFLVATGCSAGAFAKAGLLTPAAVEEYAGPGLKSFLNRLGEAPGLTSRLPLVFHMGSCVDNSRAVDLAVMIANEMGVDIPQIPFVASAPEAMSEKAVAIGSWAVALGLPTHVGVMAPIYGSDLVVEVGTKIAKDVFGGYFIFDVDPISAANKLLSEIDERNWKLSFVRPRKSA